MPRGGSDRFTSGRSRTRPLVAAVGVFAALLAASCSSTSTTSNAPSTAPPGTLKPIDGGQLVMSRPAESTGWNPSANEWASYTAMVGSTMLEPLAMTDAEGNAQPWLATSYSPNSTFDVWTLKLRPDVKFHDGTPFDAAAVKQNLDAITTAPLSGIAFGKAFKAVKVVDPLTVEVDLTDRWASFPNSFLAGQSATMMAPAALNAEDHGSKHPIGTGPFVFDSWQPDVSLKVKKNPDYWRKGLPHLDSIEFRVIADGTTAHQALKAGDIDAFETLDANVANNAEATESVAKDWDTEPSVLIVNTLPAIDGTPNPFNNQHARMALALATDRQTIAATIGDGVESPTAPFSPKSQWGRPDDQNHYPDFDLEKAKQEVEAYKKETGQSTLPVTLSGLADITNVKLLQQIQEMWRTAGMDVTLQNAEATSYIAGVVVGKYQVAAFNFYTSPDPDQDRYFWSSETAHGYGALSLNMTQFSTPTMDKALDVVRASPDFAARKAAYNDIVDQINGAATNIWLYWTPYSILSNNRYHGFEGASTQHVGNFQPKSFLADVWRSPT